MSFLMTSEVGFCSILRRFSHSVRLDVSAHVSALDDEEFFVLEGSGWRGRRESDSQVFSHLNSVHALVSMYKHDRHASCPHHHQHHSFHPVETNTRNDLRVSWI